MQEEIGSSPALVFAICRQMKRSCNREVVGRVTPIDVVVKDFRFENFYTRRGKNIINLIALAVSLKLMSGSDVFGIRMQHAKRIDHWNRIVGFAPICSAECGLAFEIHYNQIAFAGVEITCYDKWVFVLPILNTLSQQDGTFFAGRLGNMVQMKIKDVKSLTRFLFDKSCPGADSDTGIAPMI